MRFLVRLEFVLCGLIAFTINSSAAAQTIPTSFSWSSTGPIISAKGDASHSIVSVKDPSAVYYNGQWIVYASNANSAGGWGMEYLHFTDWSQAGAATPYFMDDNPNFSGYHTAPQVFYFAPQNKWYLIFQSGQPQYSTNSDPTQPQNWTAPKNFFASQPSNVSAWLDFWIICDSTNAYLFFCGDNGNFYRSSTPLGNFPNGFSDPVIVYSEANSANLFEADNVYTVEGTGMYLANIECMGPNGHRFFRALTATSLGGAWTPLGNTLSFNTPFLGLDNVTFQSGVTTWTDDFSSGGALIDGNDQTDPVNINNLQFLYQGVNPNVHVTSYALLPYQLGLATSNANKPTSPTPTPGCTPAVITPYLQVNAGTWQTTNSVTVGAGATVNLGPQPVTGGTWSWTGPNGFTAATREIDGIPLSAGANIFVATDTNPGGCKSTETFTITVTAPNTSTPTFTTTPMPPTATSTFTATATLMNTPTPVVAAIWRVNAGGPTYTDTLGNPWAADENFSGGSVASGGAVTGTADSTLYDTQRYGNSFSYAFRVPAGSYQVTLKFAETYSGDFSAGDRVFNVSINGANVLSNLDVYAQVGANTADDKVINNVSPSNGVITIQFTGGTSTDTNAMVEAIQAIPQPATPTFTNTPTRTSTATGTPTATSTSTRTSTATFTFTPTVTSTVTASRTSTAVPPTATNTALPATSTFTSVPATATQTNSPVPPTATNTPAPPTVTNTPVPPTATNTAAPPTASMTPSPTASPTLSASSTSTATPTRTTVPPTFTFTATPSATPTRTPVPPTSTPTLVPTATPAGAGSLTVYLLSGVTANTTNSPHPQIEVKNTGTAALNLNNVEVRYWFNCDCTGQSIQTWVDWAGLMPSGSTVTANVLTSTVVTTLGGQTDYVSYKFSGNLVLQPGQSIQIQSRFNKSDWSNMLQNNDWSFTTATSFVQSTHITGYVSGTLVWGQEPTATAPAAQTANVVAFPNPSTGNGVNLSVNMTGSSSSIGAKSVSTSTGIDPDGVLTFRAYSLDGQLVWVKTVDESGFESSGHSLYWNERNLENQSLSSGLYIVTVTVKSRDQTSTATTKVAVLK